MIRSRFTVILCIVVVALFAQAAVAQSQTTTTQLNPFEVRSDPVFQVASYYNAINVGDYQRAYSYWETPPRGMTLAQFTAGFADTTRVAAFTQLPVLQDAGAGNVFANVPVLLVSEHADGSQTVFSGCITTHKVNVPEGNATEPDPNWRLRSASVSQVTAFEIALLATACEEMQTVEGVYDSLFSPVDLLASYFNAIENQDYTRAYNYWETPPQGATLNQFAAGFANTGTVSVVLRLDFTAEGAAGSIYATMPALVTATTRDGSGVIQHFDGCYTARASNVPVDDATEPDPNWHLYSADVQAIEGVSDGLTLLEGMCEASG